MDLSLTPDIYAPSVDSKGNYIDRIPIIKNGIICPCNSSKDKIYKSISSFTKHTQSMKHQKWLLIINQNKPDDLA